MFTDAEVLAAVGGVRLDRGGAFAASSVCTDSRQVSPGTLFVALRGEKFDGHDFLDAAARGGAAALVVETSSGVDAASFGIPVVAVADTLRAYQALGRWHRLRFPRLKVAAVTGSMGKTSVKEMLRSIFTEVAGASGVLATEGNTNNQIGVVQNLLRLDDAIRYAVIEMGTSAPGEIEPLSAIALPDAAVVNSIGPCHLEKLIDFAGVAREKSSIFLHLASGGTAVIPACSEANEILREAASKFRCFTFGPDTGAVRSHYLAGSLEGGRFTLTFPDGAQFEIAHGLHGAHQACNAAAAAAAAFGLGIAPEVIARGLAHTRLPGMRMKIVRRDGAIFCNDAYNANPASMRATLAQLAEYVPGGDFVAVLGDMLELGPEEDRFHREILAEVGRLFPGCAVWTAGPRFERAARGAGGESVRSFPDAETLRDALFQTPLEGKTILLKGSRGMHLEKVLEA